jgi:hypothetical protein
MLLNIGRRPSFWLGMSKRKLHTFLSDSSFTAMRPTIQLNARERQLRQLLLDVSESINKSNPAAQPVIQ